MRYLCLIYDNEAAYARLSEQEQQTIYAKHTAFGEEARQRGVFIEGEALQSVSTATTVRVREGKALTTDGPFAETKEQLGGYYLLNCKNLDEAIEFAAKIPVTEYGSIEIRPIMEFE